MGRRQGRRDRRHNRYDVDEVKGQLQFSAAVSIVNISAGGMQVRTSSHLNIGRRYVIKLARGEETLRLAGTVAWCVLKAGTRLDDGEVAPAYEAGIAFTETLSDSGRDLVEFIDDCVVIDVQRRLFGRFGADEGTTATADTAHAFQVVRLSQSGMLIETDVVPDEGDVFELEMELGSESVATVGRVAYVAEDPTEDGLRQIGLEFRDLGDEQRRAISRFIETEFTQVDASVAEVELPDPSD